MTAEEINKKLKARQSELGLTQEKLAKRANMSRSKISRIMSDAYSANVADFILVCEKLKLPKEEVGELFF